jgi:cell division protein FtsB
MKLPKIKLNGSNALNFIGTVIVLYLVVVLIQTVQRNYTLGKQIDALNAQIALLQSQKDQLAYSIQYYNTDSFRDREARSKLGLQLPGESVVIIPKASPTPAPVASGTEASSKRSNFSQWLAFLGGKR